MPRIRRGLSEELGSCGERPRGKPGKAAPPHAGTGAGAWQRGSSETEGRRGLGEERVGGHEPAYVRRVCGRQAPNLHRVAVPAWSPPCGRPYGGGSSIISRPCV